MKPETARTAGLSGASGTLVALVAADGSATHPYLTRLSSGIAPLRDLGDLVHQICLLHARHPDLFEQAAAHSRQPAAAEWLAQSAQGFAAERAYLVRLVAAAGPLPSTPGQAASEAAVTAQRHALDMLAQSDRNGCADGTAIALALDWPAIRAVLDILAGRVGVDPIENQLPPAFETATVIDVLAGSMSVERAMAFGAQQMLAQHRGLIDLLEARASARGKY
ncbi:hypothetical protein K9B35_04480 [Sphingomonas sp. R647]|uniref:DUF6975 family protein n=1 Tax=Sphingomonas sp. R647 TaxID=2875233 RepID=UPI001CD470F2|nr:hypothetical protein [Sphingomonas sp. R647]MCA1197212.1 hypothetical protein [Sphingomonas sp. R647]